MRFVHMGLLIIALVAEHLWNHLCGTKFTKNYSKETQSEQVEETLESIYFGLLIDILIMCKFSLKVQGISKIGVEGGMKITEQNGFRQNGMYFLLLHLILIVILSLLCLMCLIFFCFVLLVLLLLSSPLSSFSSHFDLA